VVFKELQGSDGSNLSKKAKNDVLTSAVKLTADECGKLTARQVHDTQASTKPQIIFDLRRLFRNFSSVHSCKSDCVRC
jgi:hypothetical protein